MSDLRIGHGFDVHRLEAGRPLRLCGTTLPSPVGLAGHSDADVALHAVCDAILGALAAGDIGDHFPPTDPSWRDADSRVFVRRAVELAAGRGLSVANCDVTVIAERPRLAPHREAMRSSLGDVLGVAIEEVSVKATTTEGLGFAGRGEGIAATAVVLLAEADRD